MFRQTKIIPAGGDPSKTNNALHNAILARDNEKALELVKSMKTADINKQSLGNSPLMLALKTGNLPVARALLQREDIAVCSNPFIGHKVFGKLFSTPEDKFCDDANDNRGLTPLHIACALRANDIIKSILEIYRTRIPKYLNEDPNETFESMNEKSSDPLTLQSLIFADNEQFLLQCGVTFRINAERFPGALIIPSAPLPAMINRGDFISWINERTVASIYLEDYDERKVNANATLYKTIVDNDNLIIHVAPELTDMLLFHTKLICLNLGLKEESDFEQHPSSQHQFVSDIKIGLNAFIDWRNKEVLDPELEKLFTPESPAPRPELNI